MHDSLVLDSVSRVVNTDSIYHLFRRALQPRGVDSALVTAVQCERTRLVFAYGYVPTNWAIARMADTVYRDIGVRSGEKFFASRMIGSGVFSSAACGPMGLSRSQIVDGVRTGEEPVRPPR